VVRLLQDPLYRLALRMTWRPADAEDATQEILIRVVTRLASWRGEAQAADLGVPDRRQLPAQPSPADPAGGAAAQL
jgi:hypothetical protein